MTTKSIRREYFNASGDYYRIFSKGINSGNSPRVNGHLVLRPNSLTQTLGVVETPSATLYPSNDRVKTTALGTAYPMSVAWSQSSMIRRSVDFDLEAEAIAKFWNKAASFSLNAAEMMATRKQTIDMVTKGTLRLFRTARALRRGRVRDACKIMGISYKPPSGKNRDNFPGLWLEYSYGWAPLLGDIHTILDKPFQDPFRRIRVSRKRSADLFGFLESRNFVYSPKNPFMVRGNIFTHQTQNVTVNAVVVVPGNALSAASDWGLTSPASLAWELMPWSFVIDWFLPVGNYLEQMALVMGGLQIKEPSITRTVKNFAAGSPMIYDSSGYRRGIGRYGEMQVYKNRTLTLSGPPLPRFKNPLSISHFQNALALLATQFGRKAK
jgi:hypothetical protein